MTTLTITIKDKPDETAAIAIALRRFLLRTYPAGWVYDNCADGQDKPRQIEVTNNEKRA